MGNNILPDRPMLAQWSPAPTGYRRHHLVHPVLRLGKPPTCRSGPWPPEKKRCAQRLERLPHACSVPDPNCRTCPRTLGRCKHHVTRPDADGACRHVCSAFVAFFKRHPRIACMPQQSTFVASACPQGALSLKSNSCLRVRTATSQRPDTPAQSVSGKRTLPC